MAARMRILLVGDYARDARLGSTKVLVKLQEEFRALGHVCDLLLADDLGVHPATGMSAARSPRSPRSPRSAAPSARTARTTSSTSPARRRSGLVSRNAPERS